MAPLKTMIPCLLAALLLAACTGPHGGAASQSGGPSPAPGTQSAQPAGGAQIEKTDITPEGLAGTPVSVAAGENGVLHVVAYDNVGTDFGGGPQQSAALSEEELQRLRDAVFVRHYQSADVGASWSVQELGWLNEYLVPFAYGRQETYELLAVAAGTGEYFAMLQQYDEEGGVQPVLLHHTAAGTACLQGALPGGRVLGMRLLGPGLLAVAGETEGTLPALEVFSVQEGVLQPQAAFAYTRWCAGRGSLLLEEAQGREWVLYTAATGQTQPYAPPPAMPAGLDFLALDEAGRLLAHSEQVGLLRAGSGGQAELLLAPDALAAYGTLRFAGAAPVGEEVAVLLAGVAGQGGRVLLLAPESRP